MLLNIRAMTIDEIIAALGGAVVVSYALGISISAVRMWKNRIPAWYIAELVVLARMRGETRITESVLLAARRASDDLTPARPERRIMIRPTTA